MNFLISQDTLLLNLGIDVVKHFGPHPISEMWKKRIAVTNDQLTPALSERMKSIWATRSRLFPTGPTMDVSYEKKQQ